MTPEQAFRTHAVGLLGKLVDSQAENARLLAALVSIGILNASGKNPDHEIDRIIREVAKWKNLSKN